MASRARRGETPRSTTITVRLTEDERAQIEQRAAAAGQTVSGYAAEMILKGKVVVNQQRNLSAPLNAALLRVGNNLNQLARSANAGHAPHSATLNEAAQQLRAFMAGMMSELREGQTDGPKNSPTGPVLSWSFNLPVPRQS